MANKTKESWLMYFNPCGAEPINGFVLRGCPSPDCGTLTCLSKVAYAMAGYILNGSSPEIERQEVAQQLVSMRGQKAVSVDGTTVTLDQASLPQELDRIVNRASKILSGINSCVSAVDPEPETFFDRSTPQLQEAMTRYKALSYQADNFQGDLAQASAMADQMKATLQEAIALGGDKLGLIARHALAFGLAEKLPAIDSSGLIFVGNLDKLAPKPR